MTTTRAPSIVLLGYSDDCTKSQGWKVFLHNFGAVVHCLPDAGTDLDPDNVLLRFEMIRDADAVITFWTRLNAGSRQLFNESTSASTVKKHISVSFDDLKNIPLPFGANTISLFKHRRIGSRRLWDEILRLLPEDSGWRSAYPEFQLPGNPQQSSLWTVNGVVSPSAALRHFGRLRQMHKHKNARRVFDNTFATQLSVVTRYYWTLVVVRVGGAILFVLLGLLAFLHFSSWIEDQGFFEGQAVKAPPALPAVPHD